MSILKYIVVGQLHLNKYLYFCDCNALICCMVMMIGEACRIARMESYDMMVHLLSLRIRLLHSLERMKCLLSDISKGNHENSCLRYNGPQEAYDILYASQLLKQWKDNKAIYPNFPVLLNTVSVSIYGIKTKNIMPLILDKASVKQVLMSILMFLCRLLVPQDLLATLQKETNFLPCLLLLK